VSTHRTDPGQRPIASAIALAPGLVVSVLVGGAAGIALAQVAGWSASGPVTIAQSGTYGALSVALGAALGLALLWPASSRTARKFGLMVLASSTTRMLVSLMAGIIAFFVAKPQPYVFFTSLGAAFLLCLVVESLWATAAIRRAAIAKPTSPPPTAPPTAPSPTHMGVSA
jgi:hypothetical protein